MKSIKVNNKHGDIYMFYNNYISRMIHERIHADSEAFVSARIS